MNRNKMVLIILGIMTVIICINSIVNAEAIVVNDYGGSSTPYIGVSKRK